MKKRFWGILLVLAITLTMLPTSAYALDFNDPECLPLDDWDIQNGLSDKCYLDRDIVLTQPLKVVRDATLDLNGHVLQMTGGGSAFEVSPGIRITIEDSNPNAPHRFDKDSSTGLWTLNEESGTEILYGGIITGGNAQIGGGINLQYQRTTYPDYSLSPAGKLIMTAGTIVGCHAERGGGINVGMGGSAILSGTASVIGCTATYGPAIMAWPGSTLSLDSDMVKGDLYVGGKLTSSLPQPATVYGDLTLETQEASVENIGLVYGKVTAQYYAEITDKMVTFQVDGEIYAVGIVPAGGTVMRPVLPEKDDTFFACWVQEDGTVFEFASPITEDITLNVKYFSAEDIGKGEPGVTPQLKIDENNIWCVSYDNGVTWISLGVKATGDQGQKGDKGDQGEQGEKGDQGEAGEAGKDAVTPQLKIETDGYWYVSYDGGATWNCLNVKAAGDQGEQGEKGDAGMDGEDGTTPQLKVGSDNLWYVSYDNGVTWQSLGAKATGAAGEKGEQGEKGQDGLIPYIGANGNWWLGDMDTGVQASVQGEKGEKGEKGDTGADGKDGANGVDGKNGTDGKDGVNGTNGKDGRDGKNGVGIAKAVINTNGELVLTYTNGTTVNLGRVVGNDGQDGQDGQTPYIGENGNWWIGATDTGVQAKADDAVPAVSDAVVETEGDHTVAVIAVTVAGASLLSNLALILYMVLKKKNRAI